jgi:hypothetical protein
VWIANIPAGIPRRKPDFLFSDEDIKKSLSDRRGFDLAKVVLNYSAFLASSAFLAASAFLVQASHFFSSVHFVQAGFSFFAEQPQVSQANAAEPATIIAITTILIILFMFRSPFVSSEYNLRPIALVYV